MKKSNRKMQIAGSKWKCQIKSNKENENEQQGSTESIQNVIKSTQDDKKVKKTNAKQLRQRP